MKKLFVFLAIFIFIIAIIMFVFVLKSNLSSEEKYSDEEVKNLIYKGFDNLENISFEQYYIINNELDRKVCYYKDKSKLIVKVDSREVENLLFSSLKKRYAIEHDKKEMLEIDDKNGYYSKSCLNLEKDDVEEGVLIYKYIRTEKYDGKDCILINPYYVSGEKNDNEWVYPMYWIDKKTGIPVCVGNYNTKTGETEPVMCVKNIKIGGLSDSDFKIPEGYKVTKIKL